MRQKSTRTGWMWTLLATVAVLSGCSSSSSDGSNTGGSSGTETLHPPANIDITVCQNVAPDETLGATACNTCCTKAGFSESTGYAGKCVCGKESTDGAGTCATQTATSQACSSCCTAASFDGYGWVGADTNSAGACDCNGGKSDSKVCAGTLTASDPSDACQPCCLNHGYLGAEYDGLTPECNCSGG